jgi:hypothetical protein
MTKKNNNTKPKRGKKIIKNKQDKDLATVADTKIRRFTPMCFGFPDRLMTTLRYHGTIILTSTAGALAQHGFRWNSIFDPDYTGTGHQPLYRDTYAAVYNHYAVVSARAHLTFAAESSTLAYTSVNTDDDTSPSTDLNVLAEQSHGMFFLMGSDSGNRGVYEVHTSWDCKKVLGTDPYSSQSYKTAVGSNPTEVSFLWLSSGAAGGGNADTIVSVDLEFDVCFTELVTPTVS